MLLSYDLSSKQGASRHGSTTAPHGQDSSTSCFSIRAATSSRGHGAPPGHALVTTEAPYSIRDDTAAEAPVPEKSSLAKTLEAPFMVHASACTGTECAQATETTMIRVKKHVLPERSIEPDGFCEAIANDFTFSDIDMDEYDDCTTPVHHGTVVFPIPEDGQVDPSSANLSVRPVSTTIAPLPTVAVLGHANPLVPSSAEGSFSVNHIPRAPKSPHAVSTRPGRPSSCGVPDLSDMSTDVMVRGSKRGLRGVGRGRGSASTRLGRGSQAKSECTGAVCLDPSLAEGPYDVAACGKVRGRGRGGTQRQAGRRPNGLPALHAEDVPTSAASLVQSGGTGHDIDMVLDAACHAPLDATEQQATIGPTCQSTLAQPAASSVPGCSMFGLSAVQTTGFGSSVMTKVETMGPFPCLGSDCVPLCVDCSDLHDKDGAACDWTYLECAITQTAVSLCPMERQHDQLADIHHGTANGDVLQTVAPLHLPICCEHQSQVMLASSEAQVTAPSSVKRIKRGPGRPRRNSSAANTVKSGSQKMCVETVNGSHGHIGLSANLSSGPCAMPSLPSHMNNDGQQAEVSRRRRAAETEVSNLSIQHLHALGVTSVAGEQLELAMENAHDDWIMNEAKDWMVLPDSSRRAIEQFPLHLRVRCMIVHFSFV
jgi:hypothetical protein